MQGQRVYYNIENNDSNSNNAFLQQRSIKNCPETVQNNKLRPKIKKLTTINKQKTENVIFET